MSTYVIGDIQGCYKNLTDLLKKIKFSHDKDHAILVGDLVNRGPSSLETLLFVKQHESSISIVLGNHEIFLIMLSLGFSFNKAHTLADILQSAHKDELLSWLIKQPLIIKNSFGYFVHAGIHPSHTQEQAFDISQKIMKEIGEDAKLFFQNFLQSKDNNNENFFTLRSLIYMRYLNSISFSIDRNLTCNPKDAPNNVTPWFALRDFNSDAPIYFGHWASLGFYSYKQYTCIDSGCVWQRELTALRLDDNKIFTSPFMKGD